MIKKLTLRNFKSVGEQVYDFTNFDLLVGRNNSGKSTILQALSIWQFCVDEFHRSKRTGTKGIQVVLPNFTPLPVPEFNLLWKDKTDRQWPVINGRKKQEYILISILVEWQREGGERGSFRVDLRYHSPQTIYAIPGDGWKPFRECEVRADLPIIAYVPPFSGLEPAEKWLDEAPIRQQVGKGQPGSVLRNLLLRVSSSPETMENQITKKRRVSSEDWDELAKVVKRWFSVDLHKPIYDSKKDVYINIEYSQNRKNFDIISGGSGFHQTLTLLAFLYGYKPTTILLDEPDAHLHVNLQREILDFFKQKSRERNTQFLIATHAEEFVRGVGASQIVSLLSHKPNRIDSSPNVLRAMSDVSNEEITRLISSPYILYVEGESDERILRAWATESGAESAIDKICFKSMSGGNKQAMKRRADEHFDALREIVSEVKRLMLFDYDNNDDAFHPEQNNDVLFEWKRKNIENYLLVPDAWRRAALFLIMGREDDLFSQSVLEIINSFFVGENLTLPPGKTWQNVDANVFSVVDGKRILFEGDRSLFQKLRTGGTPVQVTREQVASVMKPEELHEDVRRFIEKLKHFTN